MSAYSSAIFIHQGDTDINHCEQTLFTKLIVLYLLNEVNHLPFNHFQFGL